MTTTTTTTTTNTDLAVNTIDDSWALYVAQSEAPPELLEKIKQFYYDGFGAAMYFWGESKGSYETFMSLHLEYLANRIRTQMAKSGENQQKPS